MIFLLKTRKPESMLALARKMHNWKSWNLTPSNIPCLQLDDLVVHVRKKNIESQSHVTHEIDYIHYTS